MGNVFIEARGPIPDLVSDQLRTLKTGRHSAPPKVDGNIVNCGRANHTKTKQVLVNKGIGIDKEYVVGKYGEK